MCPIAQLSKDHCVSQTPQNFEQRTSLEVGNNSGNEAINWDASINWLLLGSPGSCGMKKAGVVTGGLGQRGLTHMFSMQESPGTLAAYIFFQLCVLHSDRLNKVFC